MIENPCFLILRGTKGFNGHLFVLWLTAGWLYVDRVKTFARSVNHGHRSDVHLTLRGGD